MDISPRCRIGAVSAATGHARQLFAGRIQCDHEVANEHATTGWTFVRITIEPYRPVRSPLATWLSCHSHRANHFDKGLGAARLPVFAFSESGGEA